MITGFCTSPNGRCCIAVINAVERGFNPPCFCNVLREDIIHKSGVTAEEIIHMYYSCGGTAAMTRRLDVCRGMDYAISQMGQISVCLLVNFLKMFEKVIFSLGSLFNLLANWMDVLQKY
jgi:hypothetical protein